MTNEKVRVICFYLPQFHPIPENDAAWGKGYTEWRRVVQSRPHFAEHYQPRISADLGFYDLRLPESQIAQAELAARYGISGFCYYYYSLGNGRRLLERPLNQMFENKKIDFPFCVAWANHHWRANWVGSAEALAIQTYSEEDARALIEDLIPMFKDQRYIKVDGKPLFVVYDTRALPDPLKYSEIYRAGARAAGFEDLYLCRMEKEAVLDPKSIGFDASIEFPPSGVRSATMQVEPLDPKSGFKGSVNDYEQTAFYAINRADTGFNLIRGVMPSWDNSARRPADDATIFHGSTPEAYESWLAESVEWTKQHHRGEERLVFVNAWNEWGESAYLEPDLKNGHKYLEATQRVINGTPGPRYRALTNASYELNKTELRHVSGRTLQPSKKIVGSVDQIEKRDDKICIAGWGCDQEAASEPLHVLIFENSNPVAIERTFAYRPDVAKSVAPGASRAGFYVEFKASLLARPDCANLKVVLVSPPGKYSLLPVPAKV
jgi:lipopolysaccharide biosynthesis protein